MMKVRARRKLLYWIIGIVLLPIVTYFALVLYANAHDRQGDATVQELAQLIDEFQKSNDRLPGSLDDLTVRVSTRSRILLILPPPKMRYETVDGGYRVFYYGFPLGPFYGYDSRTGEEFIEE